MRRVVVAAAGIADADQDLHRHAALGQSCHCLVLRDRRLPCRWLTPLHLRAQLAAGSAKQVLAAIHAPARDRLQPMMREPAEVVGIHRSEEHTSELQSLMRISYAVFCLKKKNYQSLTFHANQQTNNHNTVHLTSNNIHLTHYQTTISTQIIPNPHT